MRGEPTFNIHEKVPFDKRPKIVLCLPMGESVKGHFAMALAGLTYSTRYPLALIQGASSLGAFEARNHILDQLDTLETQRGERFDYTFWLDSDMVIPADALTGLMSRQKDVIGAGYVRRVAPYDLLVKPLPGEVGIDVQGGIKEVAGLPTGCLLIKRDVFDSLEPPVWRTRLRPQKPEQHGGRHDGEDLLFCEMIRAKGHEVWLDVDLTKVVGHIGEKVYFPEEPEQRRSPLLLPPKPAHTIIGLRPNGHG